jgi:hydroxymethylbilane synthase
VAVHSLKDLPTDQVEGLVLAAVPEREEVADVLISRDGLSLERLPKGARVGTGSLRRQAQLLHVRPDLVVENIRGNVDTRLRKVTDGEYDAILLAAAGLRRLGRIGEITEMLPYAMMLPAIGQGALGIEARADDTLALQQLANLNDSITHAAVLAERALLARLRGGCLAPVAAWGRADATGRLLLTATVLSPDGRDRLLEEATGEMAEAAALGEQVADRLLAMGAAALIEQSRLPK